MYTILQHSDLKDNLDWFVDKAFIEAFGKGRNLMAIYAEDAKWNIKRCNAGTVVFDKEKFQNIIHFLIDSAIFEVGDQIIQQTIGLPIGTDPAPFMANAHLYKYEFYFQDHKRKTDYKLAKSLNYTFRYIDDITPINDNGNFHKYKSEIYPPELILNKENSGTINASVLDLNINIINNKFNVSIFDKMDKFGFEVGKYLSIYSNIPDTSYIVFSIHRHYDFLQYVTIKNYFSPE